MSEAIIDRAAFAHNVAHLREVVAPAELMVVLKADAYGHGVVPMGLAAVEIGVRRLGVLDIDSALALRAAGIPRAVTVMAWQYLPGQDFSDAVAAGIDLGVSRLDELEAIARSVRADHANVHLKIDTGLFRNGASTSEWPALVMRARELVGAGRVNIAGVWTHIAEASEEEDTLAMQRFDAAIAVAADLGVTFPLRHLAASSAGLRRSDVRYDMVRMGGHCWGIPSFDGVTPPEIGLIPVMTLRSHVAALSEDGRRAFVPLGHADGIPLRAAGRVDVLIGGSRAAVVGVALDTLEAELPPGHGVVPGDEVILFGTGESGEQTVREWGDLTSTLGDEIVTRIARSIPRRYIN